MAADNKRQTVDASDNNRLLVAGEFAYDTQSDDLSNVLIVRVPDGVSADEYVVPGTQKTVADYNECDESEQVIEIAFVEAMNESLGTWTPEEVVKSVKNGEIHATNVRIYAYPRSRLCPVGDQ
jgi:hypothetical protein